MIDLEMPGKGFPTLKQKAQGLPVTSPSGRVDGTPEALGATPAEIAKWEDVGLTHAMGSGRETDIITMTSKTGMMLRDVIGTAHFTRDRITTKNATGVESPLEILQSLGRFENNFRKTIKFSLDFLSQAPIIQQRAAVTEVSEMLAVFSNYMGQTEQDNLDMNSDSKVKNVLEKIPLVAVAHEDELSVQEIDDGEQRFLNVLRHLTIPMDEAERLLKGYQRFAISVKIPHNPKLGTIDTAVIQPHLDKTEDVFACILALTCTNPQLSIRQVLGIERVKQFLDNITNTDGDGFRIMSTL